MADLPELFLPAMTTSEPSRIVPESAKHWKFVNCSVSIRKVASVRLLSSDRSSRGRVLCSRVGQRRSLLGRLPASQGQEECKCERPGRLLQPRGRSHREGAWPFW